MTRYSIIIPVYKNEENIPDLVDAVESLHGLLDRASETIFVVDGSPDRSQALLVQALERRKITAEVIELSRNFGSFSAIRTGLAAAKGDYVAVMAADLQEPPELILSMLEMLERDEADVAFGARVGRADPLLTRVSSGLYWRLYRRVQPDVPPGGVDVFACTRTVRDALLQLDEPTGTLIGLLFWLGFRRGFVPYVRQPRIAGKSAWRLSRKIRYMADSAYAFSDLPITLLVVIGTAGSVISVIASMIVFAAWITGRITVSGYTPVMLMVSFGTFAVLLSLGIVGGYVVRTYENSKGRPASVIASRTSFRGEHREP